MPPQIPSCPSTSYLTPSDTLPLPCIYKVNVCCLRDFLPRPTIRRLENADLLQDKTEIQWPAGTYYRTSRVPSSDEGVAFVARGRKYIFVEPLISPADPYIFPPEDTSDEEEEEENMDISEGHIHTTNSTNNVQQETSTDIPSIEHDTHTTHTTKPPRFYPFAPYFYDDYMQYEPYDFELQADSPLPKQPFQTGLYELHPIPNIHILFTNEIPNSSSSFLLYIQPDADSSDFAQDPLIIESPEYTQISLIDNTLPPTNVSSSEAFSSSSSSALPLPPLSSTTPCKCHLIRDRTLLHQHLLSKALIQRFKYEIQTHLTSWTYEEKVLRCKSVVKRLVDVSSNVWVSGTTIDTGAIPVTAGATMAPVGGGDGDGGADDDDGDVRGLPPIPNTLLGFHRRATLPEHFRSPTSLNTAQTRSLRRNSLSSTSDSSGSTTSRRGTDLFGTLVGEIVGGEMVGWLEELLKILDEPDESTENKEDSEVDWKSKKARTGFTRWFGSVIEDSENEEEEQEEEEREMGENEEETGKEENSGEIARGNIGSGGLGYFHNGDMNEMHIGERYTYNYYYPEEDESGEEEDEYGSLWVEEDNDVFDTDDVDITEEEDEEVNLRWESICVSGSSPPSGMGLSSRSFANRVRRCGRDVGGVRMRSESDTSVAA